MKALTLHQPWASLIALGVKTIETRSWSTKYRGPLAIHGAKRRPDVEDMRVVVDNLVAWNAWWAAGLIRPNEGTAELDPGPLGAVVATCALVDVVPISDSRGDMDVASKRLLWTAHVDRHLSLEDYRTGLSINVENQRAYGDFTTGRFAWILADIVPIDPPVVSPPGEWHRGLWEWVA